MRLLQQANGMSSRLEPVRSLAAPRWPDDLQLHPDQPVSDLPTAVPLSLLGWLAREGHPRCDALRAGIRTCSGRFLLTGRRSSRTVERMVRLPKLGFALLEWRYLGTHAAAGSYAARSEERRVGKECT